MTELIEPTKEDIERLETEAEQLLQKNIDDYLKGLDDDHTDVEELSNKMKYKRGGWMMSASAIFGGWAIHEKPHKSTVMVHGRTLGLSLGVHVSYGSLATTKPINKLGKFTGWLVSATHPVGYVHVHMYEHGKPVGVFNGGSVGSQLSGAYTWGDFKH